MTVTDKMLTDVFGLIHNMDNDQVNAVVDAIKLRRTRIARNAVSTFNVGDHVSFTGRGGNIVTGTVTKKAIKNVTVDTGKGKWRVPASMLNVAEVENA